MATIIIIVKSYEEGVYMHPKAHRWKKDNGKTHIGWYINVMRLGQITFDSCVVMNRWRVRRSKRRNNTTMLHLNVTILNNKILVS